MKMGRPLKGKQALNHIQVCKVTEADGIELDRFCREIGISKSELVRLSISSFLGYVKQGIVENDPLVMKLFFPRLFLIGALKEQLISQEAQLEKDYQAFVGRPFKN